MITSLLQGCILIPIHALLDDYSILYIFNHTNPDFCFCSSEYPNMMRREAAGATCLERKRGLAVVFCRKTPQLRLALSWPEWFHLRSARSFW